MSFEQDAFNLAVLALRSEGLTNRQVAERLKTNTAKTLRVWNQWHDPIRRAQARLDREKFNLEQHKVRALMQSKGLTHDNVFQFDLDGQPNAGTVVSGENPTA